MPFLPQSKSKSKCVSIYNLGNLNSLHWPFIKNTMNKDSTEFIHEVQRQFNWTSLLEPIYVNNFRYIF